MTIRRRGRRIGAGLVVLACALTVLPGATQRAAAATTSRLAGADRYATAAAVSRAHFGVGVPVAFVVTGENFADALATGPTAAKRQGPVLLVARERVPAATAEELQRLRPGGIVVVGGERSVSRGVAAELGRYTAGAVERVSGADRYGTAAAVSARNFPSAATVYVASGQTFPDALAGAPAAYGAGAPLLLVTRSAVPDPAVEEIRRLGARRAVILGGPASVDRDVESQLRALVDEVVRVAGTDRSATSAAVSASTFGRGVPAVYLATGAAYADALSAGPAAALAGAPILLVASGCIPAPVDAEIDRLAPGQVVLLGGSAALGPGVEDGTVCGSGEASARTPSVTPSSTPAYDDDAPDPHIVRFGSTWYAYTTGTTWGNNLGVLTSDKPDAGWRTVTGKPYGSTALANPPEWQKPGTQWAPGVYAYAGRYVMFYAAQVRSHGKWCLSVATADQPTGPFSDRSAGPVICQLDLGGSIDPHPFVDANGRAWLHWKNNDGSTADVSKVWAVPLAADGVSLAGDAREVLAKDTSRYPWQTTVDNPQMVVVDGVHYLFHTGGDFEGNDSYAVGYATCAGAGGPCTTARDPILSSYGTVAGPGGGTVARDEAGNWWMSYHAWDAGCTSYACGGERRLYVAPLTFR
jgi:putative cell wall-binding protein